MSSRKMGPDVELAEELDEQLKLPDLLDAFQPTMGSWSRTTRAALGMPIGDLALRLGVSQPAVTKLERNEAAGRISIAKLKDIAEALGCELVYGFIPKQAFGERAHDYQNRQQMARRAKRKIPRLAALLER